LFYAHYQYYFGQFISVEIALSDSPHPKPRFLAIFISLNGINVNFSLNEYYKFFSFLAAGCSCPKNLGMPENSSFAYSGGYSPLGS